MHSDPAALSPFLIHNGVLREAGDDVLTIRDGASARGQGAFETIVAYSGHPFLAAAHLERLRRAAERLDLDCPSDADFFAAMKTLLTTNHLTALAKARIRITLTSPTAGGPSWFVEAGAAPAHRDSARVVTIPFTRNERGALAGLKTINYGENVVAMRLAREAGADEALFGNNCGELCEGTWSNVFIYRNGAWLTPPLASGCLPGVTRAVVLELSRTLGLQIREVAIPLADLAGVEAAFLTSSLREIQTITAIDGRGLLEAPDLQPLRDAFAAFVTEETARSST